MRWGNQSRETCSEVIAVVQGGLEQGGSSEVVRSGWTSNILKINSTFC